MVNKRTKDDRKSSPKARHGTVESAREMIKLLTIHLRQGHPEALERIEKWIEAFPELKTECRALDDLVTKAIAAWVHAAGLGDPLSEVAARKDAATLFDDLVGQGETSALDRILASTVVVAHLAHARAAIVAAQKTDHPGIRLAREKILSASQKRLLSAIKSYQVLAKKRGEGLKPRTKLKIFESSSA